MCFENTEFGPFSSSTSLNKNKKAFWIVTNSDEMLQWLPVKPSQNNNTAKICQTIPKLAKQAFVLL